MTANSNEKHEFPLYLYSYVLEEYPAQLIQHHYWQKTEKEWSKYLHFLRCRKIVTNCLYLALLILCWIQIVIIAYSGLYPIAAAKLIAFVLSIFSFCALTQQEPSEQLFQDHQYRQDIKSVEWSKYYQFLRWRKIDVIVTNCLYLVLLILCGIQTVILAYKGLYPIAAAKLIGFVLSILSFRAWIQQLHKDVEFYGWALGNYSKKVPLYEMLQKLIEKKQVDNQQDSSANSVPGKLCKSKTDDPTINSGSDEKHKNIAEDSLINGVTAEKHGEKTEDSLVSTTSDAKQKKPGELPSNAVSAETQTGKTDVSPAIVVAADWLKNRPSITFWLILMITLAWIRKWIPISILSEIIIYIVAFTFSFPLTTLIYTFKCLKKGKRKVLYAYVYSAIAFIVLFCVPWLIINFSDSLEIFFKYIFQKISDIVSMVIHFVANLWIQLVKLIPVKESDAQLSNNEALRSFLIIAIIAIGIVLLLFYLAQRKSKEAREKDESVFQEIINNTSVFNLTIYDSLSGEGQKRFLLYLLADPNLITKHNISADSISQMPDHSKNNEACELAQELYNVHT